MKTRGFRGIAAALVAMQTLACSAAARRAPNIEHTQSFVSSKPASLKPYFERLYVEGDRNAVLNFERLGLAAMERGEWATAERAFDEATKRISAIYADDDNAKRAKSLWSEEKVKDFKGEPYERSLAFYYRGLLYLRAGDYENARASFLAAQFQDSQAEREEFAADFALMDVLASFSSRCAGDDVRADDLFAAALKKDPSLAPLGRPTTSLVVVESGVGPAKQPTGEHKEKIAFVDRARGANTAVALSGARGSASMTRAGDVYRQASTRGGRAIQAILDGKAEFKETTGDVADASLSAGMIASHASQLASSAGNYNLAVGSGYASLGLLAISAISGIASAATAPEADVRFWETLPRDIYVAKLDARPSSSSPLVATSAAGRATLVPLSSSAACSVAWGRIGTQNEPGAPDSDSADDDPARRQANVSFREGLRATF